MLKLRKGRSQSPEIAKLLHFADSVLESESDGLLFKADNPDEVATRFYRLRGYYEKTKLVFALVLAEETSDGGNLVLTKRKP